MIDPDTWKYDMSMERYESARTQTPRNVIFQLGPSAGPGDKTEASEVTHHVEGVMPCFSPRKGFVFASVQQLRHAAPSSRQRRSFVRKVRDDPRQE